MNDEFEEEFEKVRKRIERRLEEDNDQYNDGAPINDAMDHLRRIDGFPSGNPTKFNLYALPSPIRIVGFILLGSIGLGGLFGIIHYLIQ